jgi:hypothetical protein
MKFALYFGNNQPHTVHGCTNGHAAFEFLGFDMPVLRK